MSAKGAVNPTLRAGQVGIAESRAQEITASLRPNPNLTLAADRIDPFRGGPPHGPFAYLLTTADVNFLWERQHKRRSRLESAQKATAVAASGQADLNLDEHCHDANWRLDRASGNRHEFQSLLGLWRMHCRQLVGKADKCS